MNKICLIFLMLFISYFLAISSATGSTKVEMENLVDKATTVVQGFAVDPDLEWFRDNVKKAKALLIIPQNARGALVVGFSGGTGVLLGRDARSGDWGYPAFYTAASLSIGFQLGAEESEVILMVMTDRGLEKLLASSFKLGADLTLAVGSAGGGVSVQTADVLTYSRSKGAFAGTSLDGSIVQTRNEFNEAYYGKPASPADIVIKKNVSNTHADKLRKEVAKITL